MFHCDLTSHLKGCIYLGFADEKMTKSNGDENPLEQGTTPQQVRVRVN